MYQVFGSALKEKHPDIPLAAGWGFNIFNEGWASWRHLYKPLIDSNHQYIDAIHEHHYGGDTRRVAASYEVAYAYTLGKYGKRLEFWNTEAGGHLDPEQPGNARPYNAGGGLTKARGAMTYLIRDIAYLLAKNPDKARFRAAHHSHHTNGGDAAAFRLMAPLRGKLVYSTSNDHGLWHVAVVNEGEFMLLLFNDQNKERSVGVKLPVTGRGKIRRVIEEAGKLTIQEVKTNIQANQAWPVKMNKKEALLLRIPLVQEVNWPVQQWKQYVSEKVLTAYAADASWQISFLLIAAKKRRNCAWSPTRRFQPSISSSMATPLPLKILLRQLATTPFPQNGLENRIPYRLPTTATKRIYGFRP